ncbi:MAG: hypothetical protein JEY97_00815 [Bacteroidales bacterium]|nr:hypothetical protein [Bacteroidales bacterium]
MEIKDKGTIFFSFRKQYPHFVYEKYTIIKAKKSIHLSFEFKLSDEIVFKPEIKISIRNFFHVEDLSDSDLNNFAFHVGMIELISYWKATCSPQIIVRPNKLNEDQIKWWKKVYFFGLGEFFYLNNIKVDQENFVDIVSNSDFELKPVLIPLKNSIIVPIGGGKDSIISLEMLKNKKQIYPFLLNPIKSSLNTVKKAGFSKDELITASRLIDPKLLELNKKGYLNGHTPFSALLAFVSVFIAALSGVKNIALSNESSANEATIINTKINHQYSKSIDFEADFRKYVSKYISKDINYFSFLRPLSELQIANLFSGFPKYFPVFRSCNVGSQKGIWCGQCPKCLFTFIIFSPFISQNELVNIFGKNLFDDKNLLTIFNQLIGIDKEKPFECVGTTEEVNAALVLTINKQAVEELPFLLNYYKNSPQYKNYKNIEIEKVLNNFDENNYLGNGFSNVLTENLGQWK